MIVAIKLFCDSSIHGYLRAMEIFYSYAQEDEKLQERLEKHLANLKRQVKFIEWQSCKITAGSEWRREIELHLNRAQIILLLVSPDFLASELHHDIEMDRALQRHYVGEARVIPIILRPCDWEETRLKELKVLPERGKPVTKWSDRDSAFLNVTRGIRFVVQEIAPEARPRLEPVFTNPITNRPNVTDLLPYLCNRDLQEGKLETALPDKNSENWRRPFICIVNGDEDECLDKFKERLQLDSLPRFLTTAKAKEIKIEFRKTGSRKGDLYLLYKELAGQFTKDRNAPKEVLLNAISEHRVPITICLTLSTEDWEPAGREQVETFIDFWNNFDPLPLGTHLIVCLFLKHYVNSEEYFNNKNRALQFLSKFNFSSYPNLHGVTLDQLMPIRQRDVKYWIENSKAFEKFCAVHSPNFCNIDKSLTAVNLLYQRARRIVPDLGPVLPMNELAPELKKILEDYRC
jgi:hypothetical protein